jgi:hypothetical protein
MSKVAVRVKMPSGSADKLIDLCSHIEKQHTTLGSASPASFLEMDDLGKKIESVKDLRKKAQELHREAEKLNQQANLILGISKTQSSTSEGTLLNIATRIRNILLGIYRGREENLNLWGYNVVSERVVMRKRKTKEAEESRQS